AHRRRPPGRPRTAAVDGGDHRAGLRHSQRRSGRRRRGRALVRTTHPRRGDPVADDRIRPGRSRRRALLRRCPRPARPPAGQRPDPRARRTRVRFRRARRVGAELPRLRRPAPAARMGTARVRGPRLPRRRLVDDDPARPRRRRRGAGRQSCLTRRQLREGIPTIHPDLLAWPSAGAGTELLDQSPGPEGPMSAAPDPGPAPAAPVPAAEPAPASVEPARPIAAGRRRPVLEVAGLSVTYPAATAPAVEDVDLSLAPGATLAIVGESGSGKSTTAAALTGLLPTGTT